VVAIRFKVHKDPRCVHFNGSGETRPFKNADMAHLAVADKIAVDVFENREEALAYLGISHLPPLEA